MLGVFSRGAVEDTRLEAKAKDTKKKSEAKTKESPSKDRPSRGQGGECSRPRPKDTGASALQKKGLQKCLKKKVFKTIFRRSPKKQYKKGLRKFSARFPAFSNKILKVQKIMLPSSRGQDNF